MAVAPYLKSDTFGKDNYTVQPPGYPCPPDQVDAGAVCFTGPCPTVCQAGEGYTLSGDPPPTEEQVEPTGIPSAPPGGLMALAQRYGLWIMGGWMAFALLRRR